MDRHLPTALRSTLLLLVGGRNHRSIAGELGVAEGTVDKYVQRLRDRFNGEPELTDSRLSREAALMIVGRRYFARERRLSYALSTDSARHLVGSGEQGWTELVTARTKAIADIDYGGAASQLAGDLSRLGREGVLPPVLRGYFLEELANYEAMTGSFSSAKAHADLSLGIFLKPDVTRSTPDGGRGLIRAYAVRHQIASMSQQINDARFYYQKLRVLAEELDDKYALVKANFSMARVYLADARLDEAGQYGQAALDEIQNIATPTSSWWAYRDDNYGLSWWLVQCPALLGDIRLLDNREREAEALYATALERRLSTPHLSDLDCPPFTGMYEWLLLCRRGDSGAAEQRLNDWRYSLSSLGFFLEQIWLCVCKGQFMEEYRKNKPAAVREYERGINMLTSTTEGPILFGSIMQERLQRLLAGAK